MNGFFRPSALFSSSIPSLIPRCGQCGLYKHCNSPKMPVSGEGKRKILIVGEAPGATEDQKGKPFVGKSGQLLRDTLEEVGVNVDRDVWITNALICRPHNDGINRPPTTKEIIYCRPNLVKTIRELRPEVIILLGGSAIRSIIGWAWKEDVGSISRWEGRQIPWRQENIWITPTWHPSYILRGQGGRENEVGSLFFRSHLKAALELKSRPWQKAPKIDIIIEPDDIVAANTIREFRGKGAVAIDLETDRLKPDRKESRIVSCAISDGDRTVAFPWYGRAMKAVKSLLESGIPLIGWNAKFEQRWFYREFGCEGHWVWDGMLAAHVLDNRPEISSLKFQAFVLLGIGIYDEGIKDYMKGETNEPNKIEQVDLRTLLKYNGMDALFTWRIAKAQKGLMKNGK